MAHLPDAPLPHTLDAFVPIGDAQLGQRVSSHGFTCEIHEQVVPPFVADALDRLYGSMHASWRHLQLCAADEALPHAWLAWRRGEVVGALLFRIAQSRVRVLSEMITIDAHLVDAFCRSVYDRYPQVGMIMFHAVDVTDGRWQLASDWPVLRHACTEDHVITLPPAVDAYRALLGKSTRKTLTGYGNRVARELPGLQWRCYPVGTLSALQQRRVVRCLQRYKCDSMQERGKRAAIDRRDTARLLVMARERGLFGIATVDGRLVAGSLACRFGDHYVMLLSAADPALAHYRLGFLACYWAICDCIAQGAHACHLLWGRYAYKRQLLGHLQVMHSMQVYRSRSAMLRMPLSVMQMLVQAALHHVRHHVLPQAMHQTLRQALRQAIRQALHQVHGHMVRYMVSHPRQWTLKYSLEVIKSLNKFLRRNI